MEMNMESTYNAGRGPNKLLLWLIIVSMVIHVPVYLYMNGLLSAKIMNFIDLTLKDIKKPFSRGIPRPPLLPKEQEKPSKEKAFQMRPIQMPDIDKTILDPGMASFSSGLMEGVAGVSSGVDYKEMVLMRIERSKKYPKEADGTYKEGTVTVSFIINPDGTISNLKIVKRCPYKALNDAALQAVRDSVPFPKPPPGTYKGGVEIIPNITFEKI
jgi:protein TonB